MKTLHRYIYPTLVVTGLLFFGLACDNAGENDGPERPPESFDRAAMLENLGRNVILPGYLAFQTNVNALDAAVTVFAADPTAANLEAAQQALKLSRLQWQQVSMFQFGPAETVALRGVLNTYPADIGQVDANITSGTYVLGSIQNIAAGGFPAMDYLLHGEALSADELLAWYTTDALAGARLQYLVDNAAFVKANADFVANEWAEGGGNYLAMFLSAEKAGTDVGSALGELVNAMVQHVERFTRDGKIGIPAGVRSAGVPRPRATEAFYGGYSLELARANLLALHGLFRGTGPNTGQGVGLEENLVARGQEVLASDIIATIVEGIVILDTLSDPLTAQIEDDVNEVVTAFTKMQQLVVLLKVDMTSFLGITITFQDNDGD